MDNFFKNRLRDYAASDDGWNVPSDDLWNNAKPHFPKPRKKKYFVFILFGLFFLGSVSALFYKNLNKENKITSADNTGHSSPMQKEASLDPAENKLASYQVPSSHSAQVKDAKTVLNLNPQSDIDLSEPQSPAKSLTLTPPTGKEARPTAQQKAPRPNKSTSIVKLHNPDAAQNLVPSQLNEKPSLKQTTKQDVNGPTQQLNSQDKMLTLSQAVSSLPLSDHKLLTINNGMPVAPKMEIPKYRKPSRHEFGIGHEKYVLNLLNLLNFDSQVDTININGSFKSLNFHYTRWLPNNRWSLTTGLYLADFELDIYAHRMQELGDRTLKTFVGNEVGNQLNQRSVEESCLGSQPMLHPGETVSPEDSISVRFMVNANLHAAQLPLMIKRHWYHQHFEYTIGLGGSLDYVWNDEDIQLLEIRKDDRLITMPYSNYTEETYFSISLLAEFGSHVYLSDYFNLGLKARINVLEPVFSGIEAGMYYRW